MEEYKHRIHELIANELMSRPDSKFILKKVVPHSTFDTVEILLEDENKESKLMQHIKKEKNFLWDYTFFIKTDCYAGNWEEEDFPLMIDKEVYIDVCCILQKKIEKCLIK